ncbi:phosphatase PAP2 family protein [soil metagenome]
MKFRTTWLLLGLSALLAGIFLVLTSEMLEATAGQNELIGRIDHALLESLARLRTPALNEAAINLTALGSGVALTIIVSLASAVLFLMKFWRPAFQLIFSGFGSAILTYALKSHFERARPEILSHVVDVAGYSYPSGHSLSSAAVYFTIAILCGEQIASHAGRAVAVLLMVTLIIAIGVSRLYLGVHYFSDVSAGILLGVAWAALLASIAAMLPQRKALGPL